MFSTKTRKLLILSIVALLLMAMAGPAVAQEIEEAVVEGEMDRLPRDGEVLPPPPDPDPEEPAATDDVIAPTPGLIEPAPAPAESDEIVNPEGTIGLEQSEGFDWSIAAAAAGIAIAVAAVGIAVLLARRPRRPIVH